MPIKMIVVDETTVENDAVMRSQRARQYISRIRRSSSVLRWSFSTLGVGFHGEAAEVWNKFVDLIDLLLPPGNDLRIERIEGVEVADSLRTCEIDRERELHSPGTEDISDACELLEVFCC